MGSLSAKSIRYLELDDEMRNADLVVIGEIQTKDEEYVDGELCGIKYTANVIFPVKGGEATETITFGRYKGLLTGNLYLLSLKKIPSDLFIKNSARQEIPEDELFKMVECNGLINEFMFLENGSRELNRIYID